MYKVNEKFYKFYSEHIYGLSSFSKNHLIKHGVNNKHIVTTKINTINIDVNTLWPQQNDKIDY